MFQAFVVLMIVAQAPAAPSQGVLLGDAARRIREERKEMRASQEEMARHVLQVSGVDKAIDEIPKAISESFNEQLARMDSQFSERYGKAVLASFTPERIRPAFIDSFNRQMGYSALAGVLPWLESPLGRKVTAAENRDPDYATHERNRSEFAARLQKEPPGANRVRLIKEIELQVQSNDHMADLMLTMVRVFVSTVPVSDSQRVRSVDMVRSPAFEKGFRDAIAPELEKADALSDLYAYSILSDDELEQYVQFLRSPHGQTMNRAVWSGFEHSIEAASRELATRLAAVLRER